MPRRVCMAVPLSLSLRGVGSTMLTSLGCRRAKSGIETPRWVLVMRRDRTDGARNSGSRLRRGFAGQAGMLALEA